MRPYFLVKTYLWNAFHRSNRRFFSYGFTAESEAVPIKSHYEVLLKFPNWTDAGQIIASGVWPVGAIKSTKYPDQAYQLGKSVKKKA